MSIVGMTRRVLLLSYYFPPAGGPGVQRTLKFAKYLPSFEWAPVVLTVREGAYPARDSSLGEDVPAEAEVHRTISWDPHRLYARLTAPSDDGVAVGTVGEGNSGWMGGLARWVRANLFLPDARVGWVPFAIWRGRQLLAEGDIDVILSSGPPHSTHLIGAALQGVTGVPWVADFRDPWTDINYYHELPHTRWARRLDAALERMVLRKARAVTVASPTWRDLLAQKVDRQTSEAFSVVQNGYDAEDISSDGEPSKERFVLTHVGSLYASRNPEGIWRSIRWLRENGEVPALRIRLVGTVDPPVWKALQERDLDEITDHVPYVPHAEAVEHMRRAALLLLSIEQFPQAAGMMTGKIYEYLASGRPVIGVGPSEGDAAALLRKTEGGEIFDWNDVSGLTRFLRTHYEAWESGSPRTGASPESVQPYRRNVQTGVMAGVLQNVAAAHLRS